MPVIMGRTKRRCCGIRSRIRSDRLEVLRTVHSFDPCMACACHTFDPSGKQIAKVKVL